MTPKEIDFSKVLNDDQVYDQVMLNYSMLGGDWIAHQWNWTNGIYSAFKDYYKYMILISLVEKTLQFYHQVNIQHTYDQYYSKSFTPIEKFSILEICEKLYLPKETVRRKVLELENLGVLRRKKKQLIIDRSAFNLVKPENQIKITARYIHKVSEILNRENIYSKKLDVKFIESVIKKNFSLIWRWFYRMQIPMVIGYHKMFGDLTTFHIWGTVCMNQVFNYKNSFNKLNIHTLTHDYTSFNKILINNERSLSGINVMSISDMTSIPRATVIRKCKFLMRKDFLNINQKKQYVLSGLNSSRILPYQKQILKNKSKFLRKTLNLLLIS